MNNLIHVTTLYENYFKDEYTSRDTMSSSFSIKRKQDPEKVRQNKTYLTGVKIKGKAGYYFKKEDIQAYLNYKKDIGKLREKATQILVDFEALLEYFEIEGHRTRLAEFLNVSNDIITYIKVSENVAYKIFGRITYFLVLLSDRERKQLIKIMDQIRYG